MDNKYKMFLCLGKTDKLFISSNGKNLDRAVVRDFDSKNFLYWIDKCDEFFMFEFGKFSENISVTKEFIFSSL